MESLLRWGIEHSGEGDGPQPPPRDISQLDPDIINLILGKSDAEKMKVESELDIGFYTRLTLYLVGL
jgi:hypothetical protein